MISSREIGEPKAKDEHNGAEGDSDEFESEHDPDTEEAPTDGDRTVTKERERDEGR